MANEGLSAAWWLVWDTWNGTRRNVRRAVRAPRRFVARGRRGYNDTDLWSSDDYLAGLIAALLREHANSSGVPMAYCEPETFTADRSLSDEQRNTYMQAALDRRRDVYLKHAETLEAYTRRWDLDDEAEKEQRLAAVSDVYRWLADHHHELWT